MFDKVINAGLIIIGVSAGLLLTSALLLGFFVVVLSFIELASSGL